MAAAQRIHAVLDQFGAPSACQEHVVEQHPTVHDTLLVKVRERLRHVGCNRKQPGPPA